VDESAVIVELLGLARHRAACTELTAGGRTVGEVLNSVVRACPGLRDVFAADGSLSRRYLVSIDGERFIDNLSDSCPAGARLLILGADPGG